MAEKYGEPWVCRKFNEVEDCNGNYFADFDVGMATSPQEDTDRRYRALECVNALEGIANPQAVKAVIEAAKDSLLWVKGQPERSQCKAEFYTDVIDSLEAALAALEKTE